MNSALCRGRRESATEWPPTRKAGDADVWPGTTVAAGEAYPDGTGVPPLVALGCWSGSWDWSWRLVRFMVRVLAAGSVRCRIVLPLSRMTKAAALRLGTRLGASLGLTWSCYRQGPRHCGRCLGCVERREAFRAAGLQDEAGYSKTPRRQGRQGSPRMTWGGATSILVRLHRQAQEGESTCMALPGAGTQIPQIAADFTDLVVFGAAGIDNPTSAPCSPWFVFARILARKGLP